MKEDLIVAQVRKARHSHAARFGGDLAAIAQDLRSREGGDGRKVIRTLPRRASRRSAALA